MPSKSKAQSRLMHAAAEGRSKKVPQSVAREFAKQDKKRGTKHLPARAKRKGV